jgi:hypothetical protein
MYGLCGPSSERLLLSDCTVVFAPGSLVKVVFSFSGRFIGDVHVDSGKHRCKVGWSSGSLCRNIFISADMLRLAMVCTVSNGPKDILPLLYMYLDLFCIWPCSNADPEVIHDQHCGAEETHRLIWVDDGKFETSEQLLGSSVSYSASYQRPSHVFVVRVGIEF